MVFIHKKKHHFKFKKKITLTKHILSYNCIGLRLKYSVCISENWLNLIKLFILKKIKKQTNKKIKIFFYLKKNFNYTKLPLESRMGKGKGEITNFYGYYKSGFLLVEFKNFRLVNAIALKNYLNKKIFISFLISN